MNRLAAEGTMLYFDTETMIRMSLDVEGALSGGFVADFVIERILYPLPSPTSCEREGTLSRHHRKDWAMTFGYVWQGVHNEALIV